MKICPYCNKAFEVNKVGRPKNFCSETCKVRTYVIRATPFPKILEIKGIKADERR
jgi:hypothetical protein